MYSDLSPAESCEWETAIKLRNSPKIAQLLQELKDLLILAETELQTISSMMREINTFLEVYIATGFLTNDKREEVVEMMKSLPNNLKSMDLFRRDDRQWLVSHLMQAVWWINARLSALNGAARLRLDQVRETIIHQMNDLQRLSHGLDRMETLSQDTDMTLERLAMAYYSGVMSRNPDIYDWISVKAKRAIYRFQKEFI